LVGEFFMKTGGIKEALVLGFAPPAIFGLDNTGGFTVYLQNRGEGGAKALAPAVGTMVGATMQNPVLSGGDRQGVQTLWKANAPQLFVDVDRERARALGVSLNDAFNTLAGTLGTYYINDFNKYGRAWQVLMSADAPYRKEPQDIGKLSVRNQRGEMVPLSAFVKVQYSSGPDTVERYNNLPAVKLLGGPAAGHSSGEAIAAFEQTAKQVLPSNVDFEWTGSAFQEKRSTNTSAIALVLAAVMVFLILAALYEKWSLPFSVLLAMPFGLFGALVAIFLRGYANDVYFQIGLVTLLGLAAKNAILIVEFAVLKHQEGYPAAAAAIAAAKLRFRPIIMTSLAFILGVLPLAISHGAGAGARTSVGTGVIGGMLGATFLAIFFVPLFYKLIVTRRLKTTAKDLSTLPTQGG
jgi:hydrophobe/amphiphile efflux-1 (HAE1) family protein